MSRRKMTGREFWGYIEHDRVMKTRLAIIIGMVAFGLSAIFFTVIGHWASAGMCFLVLCALLVAGLNA